MVHTGPPRGTLGAAVKRSPAAADFAAVAVAARRDATLKRTLGVRVVAQTGHAAPIGWTGPIAVEGAATAVADLSTGNWIGFTGVGFANRQRRHADVVDALPAGIRTRAAVEGAATAITNGSTVSAASVFTHFRRADRRRAHADPAAGALPAVGAVATFQCSTAAIAYRPAIPGSLPFACPGRRTDGDRIGGLVYGRVAGSVRNRDPIATVLRKKCVAPIGSRRRVGNLVHGRRVQSRGAVSGLRHVDDVGSSGASGCVVDPARSRVPGRPDPYWRMTGSADRGYSRGRAPQAPFAPTRGPAGTGLGLHSNRSIIAPSCVETDVDCAVDQTCGLRDAFAGASPRPPA